MAKSPRKNQGGMTRRELSMTDAAAAALPLRGAEATTLPPGTPAEALAAVTTVRGDESRAIRLADMSQCLPASALARKATPKRWRLIDYRTESFTGVMIVAGQNTDAHSRSLKRGQTALVTFYL